MKFLNTTTPLLFGLILVTTLLAGIAAPQKAEALDFGTVFDISKCAGFDPLSLIPSASSIVGGFVGTSVPVNDKQVEQNGDAIKKKEECFDMLAYQVSKKLLGDITNSAKTWISSKFDGGNAGFVQNMQQQTQNEIETEFFRYIQNSKTIQNLCGSKTERDQVVGQLALNFIDTYYDQQGIDPGPGAAELVDSITSALPANSSCEDDNSLTKTTGNIDEYLKLKQESKQQIDKGVDQLTDQLGWAGGFIADTRCPSPYKDPKPDAAGRCYDNTGKITTPIIVTPPGTVGSIINNIVNSDVRRSELADELTEVLNSIGNLFVTKLFGGGNSGLADTDLPPISINPSDFSPVSGGNDGEDTAALEQCQQQALYTADSIALILEDIPDLDVSNFDKFGQAVTQAQTQIEAQLRGIGMLPTEARAQSNKWIQDQTGGGPNPERDRDIKPVIEAELGCSDSGSTDGDTTGSTGGTTSVANIDSVAEEISSILSDYAVTITNIGGTGSTAFSAQNTATVEEIRQDLMSLGILEVDASVEASELTNKVAVGNIITPTAEIRADIVRLLANNTTTVTGNGSSGSGGGGGEVGDSGSGNRLQPQQIQ